MDERRNAGPVGWKRDPVSQGLFLDQGDRVGDDRYRIQTKASMRSHDPADAARGWTFEPNVWHSREPVGEENWPGWLTPSALQHEPISPDAPSNADFWAERARALGIDRNSVGELTEPEMAMTGIRPLANVDPKLWPQVEALLRGRHDRGVRLSRYDRTDYADRHDLRAMLKALRSDPYDTQLHGVLADALEEAHGSPLADLIRRTYGLGPHAENGPRDNLYHDPFYNAYDGTHPYFTELGDHGPFRVYLGHERPGDSTAGGPDAAHASGNTRWVIRAIDRRTADSGYNFEVPHEEAHVIPQIFPAAAGHIDPNPEHPWGLIQREREGRDFERRMDEQERERRDAQDYARTDYGEETLAPLFREVAANWDAHDTHAIIADHLDEAYPEHGRLAQHIRRRSGALGDDVALEDDYPYFGPQPMGMQHDHHFGVVGPFRVFAARHYDPDTNTDDTHADLFFQPQPGFSRDGFFHPPGMTNLDPTARHPNFAAHSHQPMGYHVRKVPVGEASKWLRELGIGVSQQDDPDAPGLNPDDTDEFGRPYARTDYAWPDPPKWGERPDWLHPEWRVKLDGGNAFRLKYPGVPIVFDVTEAIDWRKAFTTPDDSTWVVEKRAPNGDESQAVGEYDDLHRMMSDLHARIQPVLWHATGGQKGTPPEDLDWRPMEALPEDFHAMSRYADDETPWNKRELPPWAVGGDFDFERLGVPNWFLGRLPDVSHVFETVGPVWRGDTKWRVYLHPSDKHFWEHVDGHTDQLAAEPIVEADTPHDALDAVRARLPQMLWHMTDGRQGEPPPDVDWRPTETIPEDFFAMSRYGFRR